MSLSQSDDALLELLFLLWRYVLFLALIVSSCIFGICNILYVMLFPQVHSFTNSYFQRLICYSHTPAATTFCSILHFRLALSWWYFTLMLHCDDSYFEALITKTKSRDLTPSWFYCTCYLHLIHSYVLYPSFPLCLAWENIPDSTGLGILFDRKVRLDHTSHLKRSFHRHISSGSWSSSLQVHNDGWTFSNWHVHQYNLGGCEAGVCSRVASPCPLLCAIRRNTL